MKCDLFLDETARSNIVITVHACEGATDTQQEGNINSSRQTIDSAQRCRTFRSANVVTPLISIVRKVVRARNIVVLDEKNPHIRNTRDGTMIKLDVNNGHVNLPR